jgi:hypothetical protein
MRKLNSSILFLIAVYLLLLSSATPIQPDVFAVTFVKGVAVTKEMKQIRPGTRLYLNDQVTFGSTDDFIVAISAKYGRVRFGPKVHDHASSELLGLILDAAHLSVDTRILGSRGDDDVPIRYRLETSIAANPMINNRLLITSASKFLFDTIAYPIGADDFFVVQFQGSDGALISRKLETINDTLLLYPYNFNFTTESKLDAAYKLYIGYYQKENNSVTSVGEIKPYLDHANAALEMVETIYKTYTELKEQDSIAREINTELYYYFGKPSNLWVEEQLKKLQNNAK